MSELTSLRATPAEIVAGCFSADSVARAAAALRVDGALVVHDLVSPSLIAEARRAFFQRYEGYLDGHHRADALQVGERRLMISVELKAPFDDPLLFANPWLIPLLRELLGNDLVLDSFGVVCSLPGAPAQPRHRDGGDLFPGSGIDALLPPSAMTVAIPLLEMNARNGTTALWRGSHRGTASSEPIEPVVFEGSALIWDYRLKHQGTPNRGDAPRPLLYMAFCRPWFVDHGNFNRLGQEQLPLIASPGVLSRLGEGHRRLLARARAAPGNDTRR